MIEAKLYKIVYDIPFELPVSGLLLPPISNATVEDNTATHPTVNQDVPLSPNLPHNNILQVLAGVQ